MTAKDVDIAEVSLWGETVGYLSWSKSRRVAEFEYSECVRRKGLELSPLMMPLKERRIFSFPALAKETFRGLPGLLADSLPDRFGNLLIDQWLLSQGRAPEAISPIERLRRIGRRGMGALEFKPAIDDGADGESAQVEVSALAKLADDILRRRGSWRPTRESEKNFKALVNAGSGVGGARAKALVAWNPATNEVLAGKPDTPDGFEHWLIKFNDVSDTRLGDPKGYGQVEYAYSLMARAAKIEMNDCRLFFDGERRHFMTKRFDRDGERKLHLQSLCALGHFDFNQPDANSYDQAFMALPALNLGEEAARRIFRRMVFNVMARNQDDHTKNISFLMDGRGVWALAPAYDMTLAFNHDGAWTCRHQMAVNGKFDGFSRDDLMAVAERNGVNEAVRIIDEVAEAIAHWPDFAAQTDLSSKRVEEIGAVHRRL